MLRNSCKPSGRRKTNRAQPPVLVESTQSTASEQAHNNKNLVSTGTGDKSLKYRLADKFHEYLLGASENGFGADDLADLAITFFDGIVKKVDHINATSVTIQRDYRANPNWTAKQAKSALQSALYAIIEDMTRTGVIVPTDIKGEGKRIKFTIVPG